MNGHPVPATLSLSVSGAYARLLTDWLARRHLRATPSLAGVALVEPTARLPLPQWAAWVTQAGLLLPDTAIELEVGAGIDFRHIGLLGHLVRRMPTLGDALAAYSRFEALQYGRPWSRFAVDEDPPRLVWPDASGITHLGVETVALSSFYFFVCNRMALHDAIQSVSFAAQGPADPQPWIDFFACPVAFGQPETALAFRPEALHASLSHVGVQERARLLQAAESAAAIAGDPAPLVGEVLVHLQQTLPEGGAQATRLAQRIGIAPRTLHKRLAACGWTFQPLLDATRQQLALHYLDDDSLTLSEIAFLLGYAEQSVFNRTFRNWTGKTPGHWRKHLHEDAGQARQQ